MPAGRYPGFLGLAACVTPFHARETAFVRANIKEPFVFESPRNWTIFRNFFWEYFATHRDLQLGTFVL